MAGQRVQFNLRGGVALQRPCSAYGFEGSIEPPRVRPQAPVKSACDVSEREPGIVLVSFLDVCTEGHLKWTAGIESLQRKISDRYKAHNRGGLMFLRGTGMVVLWIG
jgi:hypothetical protein